MHNCTFSLQILTLNLETKEGLKVIDKVIEHIQQSPLNSYVGPFETSVEGDFDSCMKLLRECMELAGDLHSDIFATTQIHYKKEGSVLTIDEKISKHHK